MRFLTILSAVILFSAPLISQTPETQVKVISAPPFVLSPEAEAAGIDGALTVALTVDKTGVPKNVRVLGGPAWPCSADPKQQVEAVRDAVKENVMGARFSPVMKKGEPIESDIVMNFMVGKTFRGAIKGPDAASKAGAGKIIDKGVVKGMARRLPKPEYPSAARSQRIGGPVPVQVLIDENGKVVLAGAISGHQLLQTPTRNAACLAEFSPTSINGQPVKVTGIIMYNIMP
jgi:outer membrane biosynthesis protein TonB